jgi:hypothetical protein
MHKISAKYLYIFTIYIYIFAAIISDRGHYKKNCSAKQKFLLSGGAKTLGGAVK